MARSTSASSLGRGKAKAKARAKARTSRAASVPPSSSAADTNGVKSTDAAPRGAPKIRNAEADQLHRQLEAKTQELNRLRRQTERDLAEKEQQIRQLREQADAQQRRLVQYKQELEQAKRSGAGAAPAVSVGDMPAGWVEDKAKLTKLEMQHTKDRSGEHKRAGRELAH